MPVTEHGHFDATLDINQVNAWWNENPMYNIGLALGDLSEKKVRVKDENGKFVTDDNWHYVTEIKPWIPEGAYTPLVCVDDDSAKHNTNSCIDTFEEETGLTFRRNTINWNSANGGHNFLFSDPDGVFPRKRLVGDRIHCDILGAGACTFPPSFVHPSHESGSGMYTFCDDSPLLVAGETEKAFVEWFLENYKEHRTIRVGGSSEYSNYVWPSEIKNGSRNNDLLSVCRSLCAKGFSEEFIAGAMEAINEALCSEPVYPYELDQIRDSACRYGINKPDWIDKADTAVDALKFFGFFLSKKDCNPDLIQTLAVLFCEEHLDCEVDNEEVPRILNSYFKCINRKDLVI